MSTETKPYVCPSCNNHCSFCAARARDCIAGCTECRQQFRFAPTPAAPSREKPR